jgi:hypothetical protein
MSPETLRLAAMAAVLLLILLCAGLVIAIAELVDEVRRLQHSRTTAFSDGWNAAQAELRRRTP